MFIFYLKSNIIVYLKYYLFKKYSCDTPLSEIFLAIAQLINIWIFFTFTIINASFISCIWLMYSST